MRQSLRVLLIEDEEADAVLVLRELSRAEMEVESIRIETREQMEAALTEPWDLIIADYSLPVFGAEQALEVVQLSGLDIPFIIVSGTIDEERAVTALRAGAHDFVTKTRLARLVPAVERAIRDRALRQAGRQADELSRQRGRELDSLAQNIPDLIARFDRDLRFTYVNPALASAADMTQAEFIGRSSRELDFAPDAARTWTSTMEAVLASGDPMVVEFSYPAPEGIRWFQSRVVPERSDGVIVGVLSITRETTAQKRISEELRVLAGQQAAVARLGQRALSGLTPEQLLDDAVRIVHEVLDTEIVHVAELSADARTLTLRNAIGWADGAVDSVSIPADAASPSALALRTNQPVVVDDLLGQQDYAEAKPLLDQGARSGITVVIRGHDAPRGVLGAYTRSTRRFTANELQFFQAVADIIAQALERHRVEQASRNSEERVRAIIESVTDGIVFVNHDGQLTFANQRAEEIMRLQRSDMTQRAYDDPAWKITAIDGGEFPEEELPFARVMKTGGPVFDVEHAIEHPDGSRVLLSISGAPLRAADGRIEGMVASVRDVTNRREAESRIRFQANLLDAVGEAVIATDVDGTITYWNSAAERLYGWSAAEVQGRSIMDVTPSSAAVDDAAAIMVQLTAGRSWSGEFEVRRKDDSTFVALVTNSPIIDEDGTLAGIVGTSSDMTGRRRLEAELRQAQKMEAVGRLAGGVAHDFNNILTSISGFTEFLLDGLQPGHALRDDALQIRAAAERAAGLTRQLLAFSRKQVVQSTIFELGSVVTGLEPMLARLIGEDIRLSVRSGSESACVQSDAGLIEQVVVNLVVNAVDAVSAGGEISVEVTTVALEAGPTSPGTLPTGDYVLLTVSDTGCGIDAEVMAHMFEPFFTTKGEGKGTGLGLSMVHGIITQANGHIDSTSRPGVGTTFRIYLPRVDAVSQSLAATAEADAPAAPLTGQGTILLVEDDAAVRNLPTLPRARRLPGHSGGLADRSAGAGSCSPGQDRPAADRCDPAGDARADPGAAGAAAAA